MDSPPQLDHIAVAVEDLDEAREKWARLFSLDPGSLPEQEVESEGIRMVMIPLGGGAELELMEPVTEDSAVAKFLDKRGEGIHHIGFRSDDLEADWSELEEKDLELASDGPVRSSLGDLIGFIHPRALNSVLVEFKQHGSSPEHG